MTTHNVVPIVKGGLLPVVMKPIVQASIVYDEESGVGIISITSDSIAGGTVLCHLTPEIAEGIGALIEETNNSPVGPKYA